MNWLQILADELQACGVPGRTRHRIVLELRDHIACEPGCEERLGDPGALAATFADELASSKSRRSAMNAFVALAVTALALAISQLTLGRIGYPGFDHGLTPALFWPALVGMFLAPQVALVSGTLAALRAVRRRGAIVLPAAELALITRRTRIALAAGLGTVAGMELYVLDFSQRLPSWWLGLTGGLGLSAAGALICAWRSLDGPVRLRSRTPGPAGNIFEDLPVLRLRWLRAQPWRLGVLAALLAGVVMAAFEAHAEHSLAEGLQRGVVEGLAATLGLVVLGRAIGVVSSRERLGGPPRDSLFALESGSGSRRVNEADRLRAECIVREGFARGQISLDELSERVSAIHAAGTLRQLRATLTDLL